MCVIRYSMEAQMEKQEAEIERQGAEIQKQADEIKDLKERCEHLGSSRYARGI